MKMKQSPTPGNQLPRPCLKAGIFQIFPYFSLFQNIFVVNACYSVAMMRNWLKLESIATHEIEAAVKLATIAPSVVFIDASKALIFSSSARILSSLNLMSSETVMATDGQRRPVRKWNWAAFDLKGMRSNPHRRQRGRPERSCRGCPP